MSIYCLAAQVLIAFCLCALWLPAFAEMSVMKGEKEWYFFCPRDRKYRNSPRPNRVTEAGFWKATGTDRPIYSGDAKHSCIGLKKSLVFYTGRAAKSNKTDWMMHEFRMPASSGSASIQGTASDEISLQRVRSLHFVLSDLHCSIRRTNFVCRRVAISRR